MRIFQLLSNLILTIHIATVPSFSSSSHVHERPLLHGLSPFWGIPPGFRIDGDRHSRGSWFIMAPYENTPFGGWAIYFHYGVPSFHIGPWGPLTRLANLRLNRDIPWVGVSFEIWRSPLGMHKTLWNNGIFTSWWFQPIWKILVKMGIFPKWGWK